MKFYKKKKAFALTETLLAIAVIIIIGVGAYKIYTSLRDDADIQIVTNGLVELRKIMDTSYSNVNQEAQFGGLNLFDFMQSNGTLPDNFQTGSYKQYSIFSTQSYGASGVQASNQNSFIYIAVPVYPATFTMSQCMKLMKNFLPLFDDVSFGTAGTPIKVNGIVQMSIENQISQCQLYSGSSPSGQAIFYGSDSSFIKI